MELKIAAGCGIEKAYVGPSLLMHALSDPLRELIIKQRKRAVGNSQTWSNGISQYWSLLELPVPTLTGDVA